MPRPDRPVLYIAGDVHLIGGDWSRCAFLRWLDELAQRPPARLVLLGDLFEYWLETDAALRRYEPVFAWLRLLAKRGWRLDLVRGNRELAAGRRLAAASRCHLHDRAFDIRLGLKRLRVVHGDRLCHDPPYRCFSAVMRGFWLRAWQPCVPALAQDLVARLLRARSKARQMRLRGEKRAARRIFIDPRRLRGAARGADTLIAGHVHESWRRRVGGVDLILVGDWPATSGHWLEGYADGRLERRHRDFTGDMPHPLPALSG